MIIKIGDKLIRTLPLARTLKTSSILNEKSPCFIIAEAGVNHNGNLGLAKKLVDVAKEAGADAVKFQTAKAEDVVTKTVKIAEYQKRNIGKEKTQLEMIKGFELKYKDFTELKKYCVKKRIIFLSTPHSEDAVDFLDPLVSAFKVGSGDLTNLPVLEKIAKKRKPMLIGTGMATLEEVKEAVKTIKKAGNNQIILLHCTTNYPTPLDEVNLKAMLTMKEEFGLPIGYSDHTLGIIVPIMARVLGAQVIEKHFTLDKNLPGPDHKASLEPEELKEMMRAIRDVETALGSGIKKPNRSEEKIKKIVRKSIVAKLDIPKGVKLLRNMLIIKRPGIGIEPKYLNRIINKKTREDIKEDSLIKWEQLL